MLRKIPNQARSKRVEEDVIERICHLLEDLVNRSGVLTAEGALVAVMDITGIMRGIMLSNFQNPGPSIDLSDRNVDAIARYWTLRVPTAPKSE